VALIVVTGSGSDALRPTARFIRNANPEIRGQMRSTRRFTVLGALCFPVAIALVTNGCDGCTKENEESAPPATTTTPTPTPTPTAVLTPEEDAGADAADDAGDADAGKKVVGTGDPTGVRKCCSALRQNANTAPPEQKGAYITAATACDGLVNNPQGRAALAQLRGLLLGAQMPAACQ
jgi:hypothetical protein